MKVLATLVVILVATVLLGCGSDGTAELPSGENCAENVAYLQAGVDAYKEALGVYPAEVAQLLAPPAGTDPFVEAVPACPSGNIYVIQNGVVTEAASR